MDTVQPTQIIILGGGGDLAQRKLLPALFDLYTHDCLPEQFSIIGLARTERSDAAYQTLAHDAIVRADTKAVSSSIDAFCAHIAYVTGSLEEIGSYQSLSVTLEKFESNNGIPSNKLFYLAVPPANYETIFKMLHKSRLASPKEDTKNWTRILVEKPFGSNYVTAQELDNTLSSLFSEDQIFRIDHYLAKEAVQNILSFRFANTLLSSPWNKEYIKSVRITMHETLDVGNRGSFYDGVGALRDVGQNHLLQILALIAMDEPKDLAAEHIRSKRAEILESLIPITKETVDQSVVRAQYEEYRKTIGVAEDSDTETYFEFKAYIDSETWRNVPFIVTAGKALKEAKVCVEIFFRDVATGPFDTSASSTVGNTILLTISPEQSMQITLNVKKPGLGFHIESRTLSYRWSDAALMPLEAYQTVLLDCIEGDQTLFTKTEEVLASWKFITSIMDNWHTTPLLSYKKGSGGPSETVAT